MKNFNYRKLSLLISVGYMIIFAANCNKISQDQQRRKFEFLYKMSNYAAMQNEFTGSLAYAEDLTEYIIRMEKLYDDAAKMKTIDGWEASANLKNEFLNVIKSNIEGANRLAEMNLTGKKNLQKEDEFIQMNERLTLFQNLLQDEITTAGKQ